MIVKCKHSFKLVEVVFELAEAIVALALVAS